MLRSSLLRPSVHFPPYKLEYSAESIASDITYVKPEVKVVLTADEAKTYCQSERVE